MLMNSAMIQSNRVTPVCNHALKKRAQLCKFALVKLLIAPVVNEKSTTRRNNFPLKCACGDTSQNYRNSYICCELSFECYFTYFHNKYKRKSVSLCPYFVICFGNIELYFENCPCFIWNGPWFMPDQCEPGAILKCKLHLVPAGLFQGLFVMILISATLAAFYQYTLLSHRPYLIATNVVFL